MKVKATNKRVKLLDTGQRNQTLAIVLPPIAAKPKPRSKQTKERNRQSAKAWKDNNPDKYKEHLEYVKQWRKDNKEKSREYNLKWRENNRDKYNAQQREYHRNHRIKKKAISLLKKTLDK